eukprot:60457_1
MSLLLLLVLSFAIVNVITHAVHYDEIKSLNALYYSFGSFCGVDSLQNWNCEFCHHFPHFSIGSVIDEPSNQLLAYTGYDLNTSQIVLAFRGSQVQNWKNWVVDGDWKKVSVDHVDTIDINGNALIHRGFYRAIHALLNTGLYDSIQALFTQHKHSKVLLTGHSLGGALAQVLALMFNVDPMFSSLPFDTESVEVITFGSPRWGSKDLVTYFNSIGYTNWRIVNRYDIIPTLPVKYAGYYHPASKIEYTNIAALAFVMCDGDGENSSNCEPYTASLKTKYHKTYLKVYEDDCGKTKFTKWCAMMDHSIEGIERRLIDNNDTYCLYDDEQFTNPNTSSSNEVNAQQASESKGNNDWLWIVGVCGGCLLVLIVCGLLHFVYQKKVIHNNEDNNSHYQQIMM